MTKNELFKAAKIEFVDGVPDGHITINEFCDGTGRSPASVSAKLKSLGIAPSMQARLKTSKRPVGCYLIDDIARAYTVQATKKTTEKKKEEPKQEEKPAAPKKSNVDGFGNPL